MRKIILSAALVFTLAGHAQQAGGGAGAGAAGSSVGGAGGAGTGSPAAGTSGTGSPVGSTGSTGGTPGMNSPVGSAGTSSTALPGSNATLGGTGSPVGGTQAPSTGSFTVPSTQPLDSSGLIPGSSGVNELGTGGAGQVGTGTGSSSFYGTGTTGTSGMAGTGSTLTQPGTVPGTVGSIPPLGGTAPAPGTAGTGSTPAPGTGQVGSTPAPSTMGTGTGVGTPGGASTSGTPGTPGGSAALTPQQAEEEIARLQSEVRRLQAEADRNRDEGTGGSGTVGDDTAVASAIFEGRVKDVSPQAIEVIDFETGEPYLLRVNDGTRATRGAKHIPLARIQEGSRVRASFELVSGETVATNIQLLKRR
jgi:hypothetical protein